jgi:hypothetical protein
MARRRNAKRKPARRARTSDTAAKRQRQASGAYDNGCEAGWQSDAGGSYARAKAWVKKNGTRQQKNWLAGSTAAATQFRKGLKTCTEGFESIAGEFNPKRRRNRRAAPRRRRNYPKGRAAEAAAYEAGVPRSAIARIKRRKPTAWQDAPSTKSQMHKTAKGLSWDVTSGHNTPWQYQIRKLQGGYVVGFKAQRKGAVNRYISASGTVSTSPSYFKTQNEAFRTMVRNIMSGKHLPWKNPRSKSSGKRRR